MVDNKKGGDEDRLAPSDKTVAPSATSPLGNGFRGTYYAPPTGMATTTEGTGRMSLGQPDDENPFAVDERPSAGLGAFSDPEV